MLIVKRKNENPVLKHDGFSDLQSLTEKVLGVTK